MTKKMKQKIGLGIALAGLLGSFNLNPVLAESSVTTTQPQIVANQGLGSDQNLSKISAEANSSSEDFARKGMDSVNTLSDRASHNATSGVSSVVNMVSNQSGLVALGNEGSTNIGVDSIDGLQNRLSKAIDSLGLSSISLIAKAVYYGSFFGVLVSLAGILASLFFKKVKAGKFVIAFIFTTAIYGFLTNALGISLVDNPISELFIWLFTGK